MELQDKVKRLWEVRCKITNLRMEENILYDEILHSIKDPVMVNVGNYMVEASLKYSTMFIVPDKHLPHIDTEKEIAQFYDGTEVELEEIQTQSLELNTSK